MTSYLSTWLESRSFHLRDFTVEELADRKAERDVTVSVVLPSRNEAATIEGVVASVMRLSGRLVDEVVVVDGSSSDGTPERAAAAGARVYDDSEILPQFGKAAGKGDALWRSLAVTTGDIVAFVDTDIRNPDPQFVWGQLGPLLLDPGVQFVKGFYDRPFMLHDVTDRAGGGRVTELMARPLLNLFWPQLAGIVQPLGGEYAGRRELLESIPFFTGYGVEIGMLIDTVRVAGAEVIAQVDLGERIHRNQPLEALSRMAFAIAQVGMRRLFEEGRAEQAVELPDDYVQFARGDDGCVHASVRTVRVEERPPMVSVRAQR